MKKHFFVSFLVLPLLALTACSSEQKQASTDENVETIILDLGELARAETKAAAEHSAMMESEGGEDVKAMEEEATVSSAAARTVYAPYTDGVIGNGKSAVLFFAAAWCPSCQAHDKSLQAWYASEEFSLSVYKVDYDSSQSLQAQYGVVQQDTFVRIDGNGVLQTSLTFPDDAALRSLLRK